MFRKLLPGMLALCLVAFLLPATSCFVEATSIDENGAKDNYLSYTQAPVTYSLGATLAVLPTGVASISDGKLSYYSNVDGTIITRELANEQGTSPYLLFYHNERLWTVSHADNDSVEIRRYHPKMSAQFDAVSVDLPVESVVIAGEDIVLVGLTLRDAKATQLLTLDAETLSIENIMTEALMPSVFASGDYLYYLPTIRQEATSSSRVVAFDLPVAIGVKNVNSGISLEISLNQEIIDFVPFGEHVVLVSGMPNRAQYELRILNVLNLNEASFLSLPSGSRPTLLSNGDRLLILSANANGMSIFIYDGDFDLLQTHDLDQPFKMVALDRNYVYLQALQEDALADRGGIYRLSYEDYEVTPVLIFPAD